MLYFVFQVSRSLTYLGLIVNLSNCHVRDNYFKIFKKLFARNDVPSSVRWRPSHHDKSFPILFLHIKSKP